MTGRSTNGDKETPGLADSPWFWLLLFASMALVSLVVVRPKYIQRQARLEQRYDNRIRATVAKSRRTPTQQAPANETGPTSHGADDGRSEEVLPGMSEVEPVTRLWPLQILLIVAIVGSAAALITTTRRNASRRPSS